MYAPAHIDTALIIEDDYLLASDLEDTLTKLGARRVVWARNMSEAIKATEAGVHFATVDLRLGDSICYDAIAELRERGIPFIYVSAYVPGNHPELPEAPWVSKPASANEIVQAMQGLFPTGSV